MPRRGVALQTCFLLQGFVRGGEGECLQRLAVEMLIFQAELENGVTVWCSSLDVQNFMLAICVAKLVRG